MRPALHRLGLAMLIALGSATGAAAGDRYGPVVYPDGYGYGHGYGFAGEAVGGSYIGAPFTRFPRPNELVPPAWGYGTYGVPTVTGIRQAPTAPPTLTVIDADRDVTRRRASGRRIRQGDANDRWAEVPGAHASGQGGVRVISVTVPRR